MDISSTVIVPEKGSSNVVDASSVSHGLVSQSNEEFSSGIRENPLGQDTDQAVGTNKISDDNNTSKHNDTADRKNDSSTLSTAFTISFEDDASNTSKKLGIKDSIRKFAPPKPNTIEKPRQPKSERDNQENCLMSIESAPVMGSSSTPRQQTYRKSSSRSSSGRRSNSSRHSNISESAAYLIEKMLNCKDKEPINDKHDYGGSLDLSDKRRDTIIKSRADPSSRLENKIPKNTNNPEVDPNEAGSDNGTYVVGADPESEGLMAARKNIDKLFGIVKAAEASVLAESRNGGRGLQSKGGSKANENGGLSKERQERFNRLARRTPSSVSRSSSSSRQDQPQNQRTSRQDRHSQAPASARAYNSRRSSCDRQETRDHQRTNTRHRRSISQSSRHSSPRELSNGDTRSSRSSLHERDTVITTSNQDIVPNQPNNPSMKFNRAFALRRARLGLGEPVRCGQPTGASLGQDTLDQVGGMSSTQRRHQMNSNRSNQSSASTNLCRDDGGRFSLRMKTNPLPPRLNSIHNQNLPSNRSPQHTALIESYVSKVAGAKGPLTLGQVQEQITGGGQRAKQGLVTSSAVPYQSGDEFEQASPSRPKFNLTSGARAATQHPTKAGEYLEQDTDYCIGQQRLNHSLAAQGSTYESLGNIEYLSAGNRSTGPMQARHQTAQPVNANLQLGALDSLVISAISSLSLKIRHSICELLVAQAKRLPVDNETRLVVEEILPQLTVYPAGQPRAAPSIEEIDRSLYFDLAKTLKNLKKIEQMVDVIDVISKQMPLSPTDGNDCAVDETTASNISKIGSKIRLTNARYHGVDTTERGASSASSDPNSANDLSPA